MTGDPSETSPTESAVADAASLHEFDPRRLRSAGILDPRELAFCRRMGIPLAYDPSQIGWVTAGCDDDFELDPDESTLGGTRASTADEASAASRARPSVASELRDEAFAAFEDRALARLREDQRRTAGAEQTRSALWALPEAVLRECGEAEAPAARLQLLRDLQSRANALIHERLPARGEIAQRRHATLIKAHDYLLRPWRSSEAAHYRALLDDARVWRHLPEDYPDPLTLETAEDLIEISNRSLHHEVRAIEKEGRAVGQIRMLFAGEGGDDAEISYWLGTEHWGQGIAGDVIPLFTLLTFWRRPLASIFARVAAGNEASLRALARAGYRDEGDLAAELEGDPGLRTLRCYRSDCLDERPDRTARRRGGSRAGVSAGAPEATTN